MAILPTVLYLIRHGATKANLAHPPRLLGRRLDLPLAPFGIRQAEAARDALAHLPIAACYTSPLIRAAHTARMVAAPHGLTPQVLEALTECNLGRWEGLNWSIVQQQDSEAYQRFQAAPGQYGHPEGESYQQVLDRVAPVLDGLLDQHTGQTFVVVAHHVVNRTYLARLLGLTADQARQVSQANGGFAVVVRQGQDTRIQTLAATDHLQGLSSCPQ